MPTYVYACRECDTRTEVVQRMSDAALTDCESCGGAVRRVLFPPAIVYKGSGFYTTDYKNGGSKSRDGEKSASDAGGGDAKSQTKTETETKSETKAETAPAAKPEPTSST